MVDRTLVSQLQSLNASQRREAIMALGRTKDRDAIPHLSRVAENDPDMDLRELARKAAIYIDKNAPAVNVKPFKMPWDDEEDDADDAPAPMSPAAAAVLTDYAPPTPEAIAEQQDREWAERFIDRAWQSFYTGDKESAEFHLRKAFERSPAIADSETARDAASKIMGMNPDRAVAALLKPKTMRRTTGSIRIQPDPRRTTGAIKVAPPKEEKTIDEVEDGSAGTLFLDLFIYFVLLFLFNFGILFLVMRLSGDEIVASTPAAGDITGTYTVPIFVAMAEGGTGTIALYAAIGAIATIVQTLFLWFITHVVATTLMGGNSTFPRLVRKTYLFYALSTPVIIILFIVAIFLSAILRDSSVLQSALAVTILGSIFILAWRIGVAYRFDVARGCFTMILTQLALICCGFTIGLALVAAGVGPFAALAEQLARR